VVIFAAEERASQDEKRRDETARLAQKAWWLDSRIKTPVTWVAGLVAVAGWIWGVVQYFIPEIHHKCPK